MGDKPLPTKKSKKLIPYDKQKNQKPLTFEYDHSLAVKTDDDADINIGNIFFSN